MRKVHPSHHAFTLRPHAAHQGTREPAGHRLRHPFPQRSRSLPGTYTSVFPLTVDLAPASRAPAPFPPPVTCKVPVPDAYEPSDRLGPVQPWGVGREFAGVRKVEDEDVEMVDAFACPAPVPWGAGASQNASPQKNATRQHTPQRAHEDLPAPVARPPVQIEEPLWPAYHDGDKWVLARTMGPRRGSQDELVSAPCTFDAGQDACRFQANRASDASLQGCRKQEPPAPANLSPQRRKSEHVFAAYHQAEPTGPPQSAQSARRTVSATASQRANPSEHVRVDSEGFVIPTIPPPSLPDVQAPWGSSLPAEYTGQTGDCKLEPPNTPTQLHATALPHFFPMYYPSVPLTHPLLAVPAPYTVHPCSKCIARFDE